MVTSNPTSKFDDKNPQDHGAMSFKQQLDQKAAEAREPEQAGAATVAQESVVNPVVEKVTEYVPGASKVLGDPTEVKRQHHQQHEEKQHDRSGAPEGSPRRPTDDHSIEEFLRDQHRSKGDGGDLA